MPKYKLRDICHARSGDKGDTVNLGLACYDSANYEWIRKYVTAEVVLEHFRPLAKGPAVRYELPNLAALNFLVEHALDGGVTKALIIDGHGKGYSNILLELEIETDEAPILRAAVGASA